MQVDWLKGDVTRFLLGAPVRLSFILVIATADTGVAVYNTYMYGSSVGIAAHIGGMCTGLLLGIPVLMNIDEKRWETRLFYIALITYTVVVLFAIYWNAFWPTTGESSNFPLTDWSSLANSTLIPPECVEV